MAEPNYPIVDHIVKQEGPGTYNVYFKDFNNADVDSIKAWLKDNIEYNDVKKAPILPADINNSSNAYHDVEHAPDAEHNSTWTTRELNDLKVVAFSGDYNDLDNAIEIPSELDAPNAYENGVLKPLNEMAFTGRVNLNSIEVSHVLDLTTYTISNNVSENSKLQYLGAENTFIKGYGVGTAGQRLSTAVSILVDNFQNNKRPCFIISNSGYFFVLSATAYMGGSDTPKYHKIIVSEVIDANYPFEVQADITDAQAEEKLNSITISSKQITFIFDLTNKIIYCKTKAETEIDISNATIQASQISGLSSIATSGDYEDLSNKPTLFSGNYNDLNEAPELPDDTSQTSKAYYIDENNQRKIKPLQEVAFTADYEDLQNTPDLSLVAYSGFYNDLTDRPTHLNHIFNITQYQIPIDNALLDHQLDYINTLGSENGFLKGISNLKSSWDEELTDKISNVISAYQRQQVVLFINRNDIFLISNIQLITSGNVLQQVQISLSPITSNTNYNELISMSTSTDQEILDVLNNISFEVAFSCLIIDFSKDIMYSKVGYVIPTTFST